MEGWTNAWNKAGEIWRKMWTWKTTDPWEQDPTLGVQWTSSAKDKVDNDDGEVEAEGDDLDDEDEPNPEDEPDPDDEVESVSFRDLDGSLIHSITGISVPFSDLDEGSSVVNAQDLYAFWVSLLDGNGTVIGSAGDDVQLEVGSGGAAKVNAKGGNDTVYVWHEKVVSYNGGSGSDWIAFQAATGAVNAPGLTTQLILDSAPASASTPSAEQR